MATAAPTAGALALAVGSAEGSPVAAFGVISRAAGAWRSLRGGEIDARIELDLSLSGAGEGSVVVNAAGEAIGMAVFGPRRRVLVIPAATIERVAGKLQSDGRIARGYLGAGLQPVSVEGAGGGAMVMSLDVNGPGAAAGLRQGDIIITWNGEPVGHVSGLLRSLGPDSVGKTVTLGLRRVGEDHQISVTIAERPPA
jgi:S1-C subfamily serine protease